MPAKIRSYQLALLMALFHLLSFFGCKPKIQRHSVSYGPFTIELKTVRSRSLNYNTGRFNTHVRTDYGVLYRGQPVEYPTALQENTGFSNVWKVYTLNTAPRPALIVGSQRLYLLVEESGGLNVVLLDDQVGDFSNLQFLDAAGGQPAKQFEIYMSEDSVAPALQGGDYLLFNQTTVLHIPQLKTWSFNRDDYAIDGYYHKNRFGALAFSPDRRQIAFVGNKNDESNYLRYHYALIVFDYESGQGYAVPFDQTATRMESPDDITPAWIAHYFEWQKAADGAYVLTRRPDAASLPWQGRYYEENGVATGYKLLPVRPELQAALVDFILTELKLDRSTVTNDNVYSPDQQDIQYGDRKLSVWYHAKEQTLHLSKGDFLGADAAYEPLLRQIGEAFNKALREGRFDEYFTSF
jgi:hypothetical protein